MVDLTVSSTNKFIFIPNSLITKAQQCLMQVQLWPDEHSFQTPLNVAFYHSHHWVCGSTVKSLFMQLFTHLDYCNARVCKNLQFNLFLSFWRKPCSRSTYVLISTKQNDTRLVTADAFCISYPCIFNLECTATSVDVSTVQSSFGLLSTLNGLKPGGAGSRRGHCTFQHTDLHM